MKLVRVVSRMHVSEYLMLVENSLWPADDPLVVAHPDWFTDDLEPILNRTAPAPEVPAKRGPGRPRTTAIQEIVEARP